MFGGVDVARAQVAHQELLAAKDRQETPVAVVAVESAPFLQAMDAVVGRIEFRINSIGASAKLAMNCSTKTRDLATAVARSARFPAGTRWG